MPYNTSIVRASETGTTTSRLAEFQNKEERIYSIGYRLAVANAPFCEKRQSTIGLLMHDAQAYSDPVAVRSELRLSGDIGVQAVAPMSPAQKAGLRTNDTIVEINGKPVAEFPVSRKRKWERPAKVQAHLRSASQAGKVTIEWRSPEGDGGSTLLVPELICASIFEVVSNNDKAVSDGERVLIGDQFPGFAYSNDELAAAIAHEMAHNLLGHLDYFEITRRKQSLVRLSERDADRLMPWLLANAGYDPEAAVRFMTRFGPRYGGGLLRKRTHDGWDERVEFIGAEVARIGQLQDLMPLGNADWRKYFVPMLIVAEPSLDQE